MRNLLMMLGAAAFAALSCAAFTVDGKLPAGNVIVDGIEGDTVYVRQDQSTTDKNGWFYWAFRVRGAAGRTLTFDFKKGYHTSVGPRGPVVTLDRGKTYSYPCDADGAAKHAPRTFTYAFPKDADEVWFYECLPYQRAQWDEFVARHKADLGTKFVVETLCTSRKGADVPRARFGCISKDPKFRIFMSARHHCSESMASWVLEGVAEAFLADDDLGRWLRGNMELMMVPMTDYDGVQAGDQGKNRPPHDHNRDYTEFIYPETKAISEWIAGHAGGKLDVFIDVHCPWIRGDYNEFLYTPWKDPKILPSEADETRFSQLLEKLQCGSMRYKASDDLPFGKGWNKGANYAQGWSAVIWACHRVKGLRISRSLEVPFQNANGAVVTRETCRDLGRDVAKTLRATLAEPKTVSLGIPAAGWRETKTVDPAGDDAVTVSFEVPISDIQQMWTPDLMQPHLDRKWWVTKNSAPQCDMPYLAFFNMAEENRFSFGSESLEWDNQIESKIDQEKGVYRVKLTVVAGPKGNLKPFKVMFDRRPVVWTRALADWRDALAYPKGKYPEAAWRPVYCSWYAVHAAVTQDWTERTAAIAAGLGFGTFILDDGWSYDEMKRVNPDTIKTWYRDVGEWTAFSKAKFPDFKVHRERMRKLGLKYIVWTAPYFLGTRSPEFAKWGYDKHPFTKPFEGNSLTDVTNGPMMESVTEQLVTLLRTADLDGLKIDFLDYVKPSIKEPRGAASLAYIEDLMKRLREVKPEGIFEYRASYATPIMAQFGTQFRAGDVPFEWLANLMRLAQIRITMGNGVPVHADPIYWSDTETDDNVDRHFMAAMAGVPMLSMDLEKMSAERRGRVRAWLDYYAKNVEKFHRGGKWDVAYHNGGLAYVISRLDDETLVIVNDADAFAKISGTFAAKKAVVLNLCFTALELPNGVRIAPARAYPGCKNF